MLIDTGASVSIVKPGVISGLVGTDDVAKPTRTTVLRTASGARVPVLGMRTLKLVVGSFSTDHVCYIAEIADACILGMDFLRRHNCDLDLRANVLKVGQEEVVLRDADDALSSCALVLPEEVAVPPYTEMLIPVAESGLSSRPYLVEPVEELEWQKGVKVARVVASGAICPLRVMNLNNRLVKLRSGTHVANCEPLASIVRRIAPGSPRRSGSLPGCLQELLRRSSAELAPGEVTEVRRLLEEFADVFALHPGDVGRTHLVKHRIDVGTARPIKQPPRRVPRSRLSEVQGLITDMEARDIIEPSTSPWASPVVLVRKKDGSTRFCVDYRKLNDLTKKDSYPLPRIDDTIDAVAGAKYFSTLDLQSGYWQVGMEPEDKEKTAFSTCFGHWQFKVLPFGLCNAPATFERLMEKVLKDLSWSTALVYLDDIIVHGQTFAEEMARLRALFVRLREARLKVNPKKCLLFARRVKFLGHIVSAQGVEVDPEKTRVVESWPIPTKRQELRSFLGLCSYYRRFVRNFAGIAGVLHTLTEESRPFIWTDACQRAFEQLKTALTSTPVLAYPLGNGRFTLDTDASSTAVGAVLSQEQSGEQRVVAYYSSCLSKPERNYCVTRRELLAIVKATEHFHHYLYGQNFELRTDHAALRWLLNFKNVEGQLARWMERLQQYSFTIAHRPGKQHGNADALSRRPCSEPGCPHCLRREAQDAAVRTTTVEALIDNEGRVLNKEALRERQEQDPQLGLILEWKRQGRRPAWQETAPLDTLTKAYVALWDSLEVKDGLLHRRWENTEGSSVVHQLLLPTPLRSQMIQHCHDSRTGGHFGVNKTLGKLRQRFYWIGCKRDVEDHCRRCDICNSRRGAGARRRAKLRPFNVGAPFERVAIDVLGPLPQTSRGNRYLVVMMDYFTKWPEAVAVCDQGAESVAAALLEQVVSRYGVPLELHSDQGRHFESRVFQNLLELLGVYKTRTTPLHPQSDGMVERFHRTLLRYLSKFVEKEQKDWDQLIPMCLLAYRAAVHEATQYTPAMLNLGREVRLPIDLLFGERPEAKEVPQFVARLREKLCSIHELARRHLNLASSRMKTRYDLRAEGPRFRAGDLVWLYNPCRKKTRSPKLQANWEGPYVVLKCLNDVVYRIQRNPRAKAKVVHADRLLPYRGKDSTRTAEASELREGGRCCGPAQRSPGGASARRLGPAAGCSMTRACQLMPDGSPAASTRGKRGGRSLVDPATGDQQEQRRARKQTWRETSGRNSEPERRPSRAIGIPS